MSGNNKNLLDREFTRRQFMKLTGKGLAGVALSSSLLNLMGCTQAQAEAGLVDTIAAPDFLLVANRAKCSGCQRCEVSCTLKNDGDAHPYMARLRVRQDVAFGKDGPTEDFLHGDGLFGTWGFAPETCKQCADPLCVKNSHGVFLHLLMYAVWHAAVPALRETRRHFPVRILLRPASP